MAECKSIASSLTLGSSDISFSSNVVNLGVILDESLDFVDNIKNCRKNSFFILRNFSHIRNNFTNSGFESLVHAFVTSRIDYCNSLYANIPKSTLKFLESVQNYAARLVCRRSLFCHIKPVLKELHWLPVAARIDFKILLITYKAVHLSVPPYLASQLKYKNITDHDLRHYMILYYLKNRVLIPKWVTVLFQFTRRKNGTNCPFLFALHHRQIYLKTVENVSFPQI